MELHEKLIHLREEKGLSQLKVAEALDVSRQAVSKWEVGAALPSTKNLCGLSSLYGVSLDDLVGDEELEKHAEEHAAAAPPAESGSPTDGYGRTGRKDMEKISMRKRLVLFGCVPILLIVVTAAAVFSQSSKNRIAYPGSGTYDLSKYTPYGTSGTIIPDEREIIGLDFQTNSTRIDLFNAGEQEVTVYLYDKGNPTWEDIGSLTLAPEEKGCFTMLSQARQYQIGVESPGEAYVLNISD